MGFFDRFKSQISPKLDFIFRSPDHLRYENGRHVSGPHGGAGRAVKVEANVNGGEGYTVTMFNLDGNHPVWQNNVQMVPKQMKIISQADDKIVLRGFGKDPMGASFSDYGLTILFNEGQVIKCTLHMHERGIDIEYLNESEAKGNESEIESLSKRVNALLVREDVSGSRALLFDIYRLVKRDPSCLKNIKDYSIVGSSFLLMLDLNLSDDVDNLQMMSSIGYLCISKAIENDSSNLNLYKDRLLLLRLGHDSFQYTVMSALELASDMFSFTSQMAPIRARDAIYKMEIADLELHPQLYKQIQLFKDRKEEFDKMINKEFFMPEKTYDNVIKTGIENHRKISEYLYNKVLIEEDIDF